MLNAAFMLTANEAASITGVPLRQVHRIIDAGLLEGAVERQRNTRLLSREALVGLKLAYDTAEILTLEGRRTLVGDVLRHPGRSSVRSHAVTVNTRDAIRAVRSGQDQLNKARRIVASDPAIVGGAPTFKGTRILIHEVAAMLANGNDPVAIVCAYPQLDEARIHLGALYATAYPQRGRPRGKAVWQDKPPKSSETFAFDAIA